MGGFFGWKLRKHINIPDFYSGQYHQTIFHDTYFSDCIFSFICWQKSLILRISSKKFLSSKVFEDFSKFWRIFVFVFGLFSEPEDSLFSSSVFSPFLIFVATLITCVYLPSHRWIFYKQDQKSQNLKTQRFSRLDFLDFLYFHTAKISWTS